jgi:tetratricopeptide (TPR) repeat protein
LTFMAKPTVFVSYSHNDAVWKDRLVKHLKVLEGEGHLEVWDDSRIGAGRDWYPEIDRALKSAAVAILLITPDFLISDFISAEEIPRLLERRRDDHLPVFPVIIRSAAWQSVDWLNRMQVWPPGGKALASYRGNKRDEVILNLVGEIQRTLCASPKSTTGRLASIPPYDSSIARLPVTGTNLFGREKELTVLDKAWANQRANRKTNLLSLVAFGGIGKSALVNHWLSRMRKEDYRGAQKVFGWSFHSQGSHDQASSPDLFIANALRWFGDPNPDDGTPEQKAMRLADLIRKHRTLLILDGLEPLQFPPGEGRRGKEKGRLKHSYIKLLLRELASRNPGLCIVSSRLPVADLSDLIGTSVRQRDLEKLSPSVGRQLLAAEGVHGSDDEMEKASTEFDGHALALSILAHFLKMAAGGNIRRRDRIGPLTYSPEGGGHARRVLESYARWFRRKPNQQIELESLRMMGLFDRPIEPEAWKVLIEKPSIKGLTDCISNAGETRWRYALGVLRDAHLLAESDEMDSKSPDTIECHPLVREYFGEELQKKNPGAWKQANERLFEFFRPRTAEMPKTVEAMAPYHQAIIHGCFAGRYTEAFDDVYMRYIRQDGVYNTESLRAFADDYAALNRFLQKGRFEVVSDLEDHSSFILGEIGFDLRALGRPDESIEPMKEALEWDENRGDFSAAAIQAAILSHTSLILGSIRGAIRFADRGVKSSREVPDPYLEMVNIGNRADALHHAGDFARAGRDFSNAEEINRALFVEGPYLRSLLGYRYCDYLLTMDKYDEVKRRAAANFSLDEGGGYPPVHYSLQHATQIAGKVLPLALNHLARARAFLCEFTEKQTASLLEEAELYLELAIHRLEDSGSLHEVPRGMLARAELRIVKEDFDGAERDLRKVLSSSKGGGMRLYEADSHFGLARWFEARGQQPEACRHLRAAHGLVERLGYGRLRPVVAAMASRLAADGINTSSWTTDDVR